MRSIQAAIGADVSDELIQSKLSGHYLESGSDDSAQREGQQKGNAEQENTGIRALIQAEASPYSSTTKKTTLQTSQADALFFQENASDVYRIGAGDILTIYVWSGDFIERDILHYKVFDSGLVHCL